MWYMTKLSLIETEIVNDYFKAFESSEMLLMKCYSFFTHE